MGYYSLSVNSRDSRHFHTSAECCRRASVFLFQLPQDWPAHPASAANRKGYARERSASNLIVSLPEPPTAHQLPAIAPLHHVARRRFPAERQQHATGGLLNATTVQRRLRQAVQ
jgi:hypothetical protein